jgi:hypothetical protein
VLVNFKSFVVHIYCPFYKIANYHVELKPVHNEVRIYTNVNWSYFVIESKGDFSRSEILKCKKLKFYKIKIFISKSEGKNVDEKKSLMKIPINFGI